VLADRGGGLLGRVDVVLELVEVVLELVGFVLELLGHVVAGHEEWVSRTGDAPHMVSLRARPGGP
jgi:hypothetical protein